MATVFLLLIKSLEIMIMFTKNCRCINTIKLYIEKWLILKILFYVYSSTFFFFLKKHQVYQSKIAFGHQTERQYISVKCSVLEPHSQWIRMQFNVVKFTQVSRSDFIPKCSSLEFFQRAFIYFKKLNLHPHQAVDKS